MISTTLKNKIKALWEEVQAEEANESELAKVQKEQTPSEVAPEATAVETKDVYPDGSHKEADFVQAGLESGQGDGEIDEVEIASDLEKIEDAALEESKAEVEKLAEEARGNYLRAKQDYLNVQSIKNLHEAEILKRQGQKLLQEAAAKTAKKK